MTENKIIGANVFNHLHPSRTCCLCLRAGCGEYDEYPGGRIVDVGPRYSRVYIPMPIDDCKFKKRHDKWEVVVNEFAGEVNSLVSTRR